MGCLKPGGEPCSVPCSDLDGANPTLQAVPVLPGTTASHQPHPWGSWAGVPAVGTPGVAEAAPAPRAFSMQQVMAGTDKAGS